MFSVNSILTLLFSQEGLLRVALQGTAFKLRYRSLGLLRDQMHDEEVHILLEEYSVENGHFLCIYSPQICVLYVIFSSLFSDIRALIADEASVDVCSGIFCCFHRKCAIYFQFIRRIINH